MFHYFSFKTPENLFDHRCISLAPSLSLPLHAELDTTQKILPFLKPEAALLFL